ncbi:MAG: DNA-formamidopyrimidine glycosylase [Candidatus Nealsonbacteria bacterium RIFCSPLOWO2_12_FULL_39_31]|uniref:DNA-formamidopyrimidine glycosylase n=2 Tax=Candidatus Nealsoniibacteriota TaxID=1817911 RepID=A0A1G2EJ97_9BACT|nr:MAG: Formamidopyrimidine-DNA glycosylase [Parcubacteria group bacterium GW2011_GWC2_39_11]OGZ20225.1 MAG: DNA-formamidopyrimidine glycosylase [Candidatus Nealsonbacteria bacterium RIFCSPHIGHO2_01_FULL_38_55]OGZ21879.1 MAG: DNA-formamidopyrimidine glycosylase [Candidatus Nealsonbacteria bacterium RIFCSPHIGHO2_02_38_10]OGZ22271.1 MAG: DNA-formamidopyrimidine glycosylase [Candidatus Nealsonbacteria bacterium RIFCSPHIGHO2_02_FULL_38_75]OGZ22460.1 MAG: DNA-formamidopyrimidine glycosylase [Candida
MPELPEVETTVRGLNRALNSLSARFIDVWADWKKTIKKPRNFKSFKAGIKKKKIEKIWRRGKNIIFELSDNYSLLIHQKLTGHLLYGYWVRRGNNWQPSGNDILADRVNNYIHLLFFLDNGKMIALSDLRKFANVELWKTEELLASSGFNNLGPEILEKSFTFEKFKEALSKKKGKIKEVLMNQSVIVGVGNIYSDEALWRAQVNPFKKIPDLTNRELEKIYDSLRDVLQKSIELHGESFSDYRDTNGEKGGFDKIRMVYRRKGEKCQCCGTIIKRKKIGSRSCHFCPACQKI